MIKRTLIGIMVMMLISCTEKEITESEGTIDEDGFTTNVLVTDRLSLRWRVENDTTLNAALIGNPSGKGWIAIGFGKSIMRDAKVIVAQNGSDSTSVSDGTGFNYGLSNNASTVINSSSIEVSGTLITASFNVTLADVNITLNESTPIIWAYRTVEQVEEDNLGNIGKHSSRGSSSITFK